MQQVPLTTYSSLCSRRATFSPGQLHPPAQKRIRPKVYRPSPQSAVDRLLPAPPTRSGRAYRRSMPPPSPGLSPGPSPMSLSTINLSDDRRRGCEAQSGF